MSSDTSLNLSSICASEIDEDIEVYIEYNSDIILLDQVTDYKSLCQQIEDNLDGVKPQELKITYKTPTGMDVTVKNDTTFKSAKKKMKPELKLICTPIAFPAITAPNVTLRQQSNHGLQATESQESTPLSLNQQLHQVSNDYVTQVTNQQLASQFMNLLPPSLLGHSQPTLSPQKSSGVYNTSESSNLQTFQQNCQPATQDYSTLSLSVFQQIQTLQDQVKRLTSAQMPQNVVEASQLRKISSMTSDQKILSLDQNDLEKLEREVVQYFQENQELKADFIIYLCDTFKLHRKSSELVNFCNKYSLKQASTQRPTLPKIKAYITKKKIIDLILYNEQIPIGFKLKTDFEGLTSDQLSQFKDCFWNFKSISFVENDLFEEELKLLFQLQMEKKSDEEISKTTLIHIDLVQKICNLKQNKLQEETNLLGIIRKHSSLKTDDEVIQLILKDDDELAEILYKIYKINKEEYLEIAQKLRDQNYAINFEQRELQQLIKLTTLPNLETSIENQEKVQNLLKHFLNKDLVTYLMVLHDFTDIGQSVEKKNLEKIILNQQHKNIRTAIVQLIILEIDLDKKNEVILSKKFEDSREGAMLKDLEEQIDNFFDQQKQKIEEQKDEGQFQSFDQYLNLNKMEINENEEIVKTIKAISNITKMKIQVHSKSELTKKIVYQPENKEGKGTLYVVRDDLKKVFQIMIQYENKNKIIDSEGLKALKQKYSFLSDKIPAWLDTFIKLPSFRMFLNDMNFDPKRMLEDFTEAQEEFLKIKDEDRKKKLYDAAVKFNIDSQLMQDWFNMQKDNKDMADFCNFMINKGIRQKPHWAITQVDNLQKYFPISAKKQTLKDFNRVQTYQDPDHRKNQIEKLESQPERLTSFIINTLFGVILRKDDMSLIQNELEETLTGQTISLRFLVSYLLQQADFGLKARLNYYLCQNKSVPLIMNCQQTFRDSNFMNYNQELVFSLQDDEGVGVFALGVGKNATNSCGKSQISNLIVTPKFDNKSFDVYDLNVFSNGQIDVFFEKCYQLKSGWAFMDGQGKISDQSLLSVLPLTNIVLIHFMQKDQNDETSVADLEETIKNIKDSDETIQVCIILRDCTETKEINKSDYPDWLPLKEKVDKIIEIQNVQNENRIVQKSTLIQKIMLYFNETVAKIKNLNKSKFTKQNFLNGFCKMDTQGIETYQRIIQILQLSNQFIQKVQVLKENVFNQEGLPSLKIKDQIREVTLKLRQFEFFHGEDQKAALKREEELKTQLENFTDQLTKLEVNPVMEQFWKIVNHDDAVQIKIEVSKRLQKFTQENIFYLNLQKKEFMNKNGKSAQIQKDGGLYSKQDIQKANDEFKQKMNQFEDEIFQRSLSYEYFWRSLICIIADSKQCNYWSENLNKQKFKKAVQQQMLDGDTFELIDGRNLEMKADIIRQIVGYEIECKKCIIVCVIGPQSTGKSTLMNFCFGTQFLASAGRCTQGIYFTLQQIPPEMKNGSDVDYLIILDTEGLNSPERAEGDRPDSEYDRKIVLFTLLCSDFLIINSSGDMSLQMKELIKICAVRYDELRAHAKAPKILYTFVKNSDNNPLKFKEQIQSLRSDVIESSDEPTIEITADELMAVHDDLVKVLGSAYDQKLIEKDSSKGILQSTYINLCAPLFGVHASDVWQQVQNFIQSGKYQFRQIGTWLQEAGEHWSLIDRHGANITQFGNVQQMKNDRKIKEYFSQLWSQYINTQITSKDNQKAIEKCRELYNMFKDGENIEPLKKKFKDENDQEKENDFQEFIVDKYTRWKLESSQRTITVGAEQQHMKVCAIKMEILKNDYKLLIDNKFKELQMSQIHTNGISILYRKARNLYSVIKTMSEVDQDYYIKDEFQNGWDQLETEITSESQIENMRKTNFEYLQRTFKSVSKFMPEITQVQFSQILNASDSNEEMYPNSTLPKELVYYLVKHISHDAFKDEKNNLDTLKQFQLDQIMLGMLIENPKYRIFGLSQDSVKEKYLPLQKMLKVDYTYFIINELEQALSKSNVYEIINMNLNIKKCSYYMKDNFTIYGDSYPCQYETQIDDRTEILNSLYKLFKELELAGFSYGLKKYFKWDSQNQELTTPLGNLNLEKIFDKAKIFDNKQNKEKWLNELKQNMKWNKQDLKQITPTVQSLLCRDIVVIQNQLHPNISFNQHKIENEKIQKALHTNPEPQLSYSFSEDDNQGKMNVCKFLKEKNLDFKLQNYFECLVRPKTYEMGESFKWTYLSELANTVVDWLQIVVDIDKNVSQQISFEEKKSQSIDQETNLQFDLKNVLESSQINIEQAENIQNSYLQPIKTQIEYEVRQKLSLYVNHKLSGVITQVACVIIWYKLQKNVMTIFNKEIEKIKGQKGIVFKKFSEIAKGQTTATTSQFADEIFNITFNKYNEICINETNQVIFKYLEDIRDNFNTEAVYDKMDEIYIGQVNNNEYQKCINYAEDPVKEFTTYVNQMKMNLIIPEQKKEKSKYQKRVIENLKNLLKRLLLIHETFNKYEEMKDDSVNFFLVMKAGKKVEDDNEKEEIVNKMSPILINTLRKILDGSYTKKKQKLTLTIKDLKTEYSFKVKKKDLVKKVQGSPYNDLQMLVFDKNMPEEFLNHFLERLDICKDSSNFGVCTDLRFMVGKLIDLLNKKISEIEKLEICDIKTKAQDDIIHSFVINAIGCKEVCKFCNRKCELAPHQDDNLNHNCNERGHSLRVFGGGGLFTSWGDKYPSLTTCDEIKRDTKIKTNYQGTGEIRLWSEIHDSKNRNWTTQYNDIQSIDSTIDSNCQQMKKKLKNIWNTHGQRYCTEKNYKFIELSNINQISEQASQMTDSSIVILCLDKSKSMSYWGWKKDYENAVASGKKLEQYLKANHINPQHVQIQLWFNDNDGVNVVHKGPLSSTIPDFLWERNGGDQTLVYGKCGQFDGAIRILNEEVNNLLAYQNYDSVYWFFFTDGDNIYPQKELQILHKTLKDNIQRWTDKGGQPKLRPVIITNQKQAKSLCQMKTEIDQIIQDNWKVQNACVLELDVQTDKLAKTMIEQFDFN